MKQTLSRAKKLISNFKFLPRRRVYRLLLLAVAVGLGILLLKLVVKPAGAAPWPQTFNAWAKRKQITLVNSNTATTLNPNTTYSINIDTKAIYQTKSTDILGSCDDLRVVYQPNDTTATELPRAIALASGATNCTNSTSTIVSFPLQSSISSFSSDSSYYIYYSNHGALAPAPRSLGGVGSAISAFDTTPGGASFVAPFNGTTTAIASGSGTPTTATGAIRYSGGKSALSFRGTNSDYVEITDSSPLQITGEITFEMWVKTNITSQTTLLWKATNTNYYGYVMIINATTGYVGCYTDGGGGGYINGTRSVNDNQWHHVACSMQGTTMRVFVDGVLNNSGNGSLTSSSGKNLTLGAAGAGGAGNYRGLMDEVRVSNTARYTSNFTPQTSPFVRDANTKLLLHFDENGDDPRNTGKAIDDSGNANHGTITGAKYVGGLAGVDNPTTLSAVEGSLSNQSFASHQGVFIEEGTTNKVLNPSFENSTYNTNWATSSGIVNYSPTSHTFTPNVAKRNSAGPFAAGVLTQSKDIISAPNGTQINGNFYTNFDTTQGSVALWFTPEYATGTAKKYLWYINANYYLAYDYANTRYEQTLGGQTQTVATALVAGTTYGLITRWDTQNVIQGANYADLSIDDSQNFGITTQPTTSAPAATIYIGTDGTTASDGIIEGLTVYRRVLYDGTNGINANAGVDEVAKIKTTGGTDPTLTTGSWDVVFALPTNASTGSLGVGGTGNAWSHPHSSNLLYTSTTNTGGFMMGADYGTDGWASEASGGGTLTIAALAAANKIFAGGYSVQSDGATVNQGISYSKALIANANYVIRALGHSDGTCAPQVTILRADGTPLTWLTGTTASRRATPDTYIFTFQAPASETYKVFLENLAASGTCSWHQVEVLSNLISNPSLETGSGSNPNWIPTGWIATAGKVSQETTIFHSGTSSAKITGTGTGDGIAASPSSTNNKFYSTGVWGRQDSGGQFSWVYNYQTQPLQTAPVGSNSTNPVYTFSVNSTWTKYFAVFRPNGGLSLIFYKWYSGSMVGFIDDAFAFQLTDVSLTVTPASEANSGETTGLRVDGADTLTQTATQLASASGTLEFKFTPRHSYSTAALFGDSTPIIATSSASATNSIGVGYLTSSILRTQINLNGTWYAADWPSPTLNAGTTYSFKVKYASGGTLTLAVDGVTKATSGTISSSAAFTTLPSTVYFGSNTDATKQYDGTFDTAIETAPTVTQNTTAPYYKFGASSVSFVSSDASNYVTSINPGNVNSHTLSAYVYNGSTVGGTVDGSVAALIWEGRVVNTVYTDAGGGWWRLSYSSASSNSSNSYGVHVADAKTIYVDGVQLEEKAYTTTYADGSLGTGYAWTGTSNNSTSTRTASDLTYPTASNVNNASGTISLWIKPNWAGNDSLNHGILSDSTALNLILYKTSANIIRYYRKDGSTTWRGDSSGGISWAANSWHHIVITWGTDNKSYVYVDSSAGAGQTGTSGWISPATPLRVGNATSTWGDYANSTISDFRVFDQALSSDQVSQLYYAGLGSHSEAASVNRFRNPADPIAYWKMDEGTGTAVEDSSQSRNDGALGVGTSAPTWQTKDMCVSGMCLNFDGTNDVVTVAGTSTGVKTVSYWVRPTSTTASMINLTATQYISAAAGAISATNFTSPVYYVNGKATTTPILTANSWNHIEITTATGFDANAITIGKANNAYTNGFIDEVKLFDYQRTAAQVKVDYNRAAARGINTNISEYSPIIGENPSTLSQGLVGYWKLDESSGNAIDSSGNSNTGTWSGTGTGHYSAGKFGNGGGFNGTNDFVTVVDSSSINFTNEMSFSVWVKFNSLVAWTGPLGKGQHTGSVPGYRVALGSGNKIYWETYTSVNGSVNIYANSFGAVSTGNWYHVVGTYKSGNMSIYVNGVADSTTSVSGTLNTASGYNLFIGYAASALMNGSADDVRIYSRSLSPAEVRQLYDYAPGPVAHWKFEEGTGTTVSDSSGNSNTGTWSGTGNHWTQGKIGKAGNFTATSSDFVSVANTISTNSVAFWIKPTTNTASMINLTATQYITASSGTISATNFISPSYYINGILTASPTLTANQWNYIVVTTGTAISANAITLGKANSAYTTGLIDDVRIYNYARTQKQILSDMSESTLSVVEGSGTRQRAIAYYDFDEGSGTTTNNLGFGGSSLNGTLGVGTSAPTWSMNGKFARALSFDGSNDYVSLPNVTQLNITGDITLSTWIKTNRNTTQVIIGGYQSSPSYPGYGLAISVSTSHKLGFESGSGSWVEGNISVDDNNWHHVVVTLNGTTATFYVDGKVDKITTASAISSYSGIRAIGATSGNGFPFSGLIDDVKIYNYALTLDEVKTEYNRGAALSLGSLSNTSNLTGGSVASNSASAAYCIPGDTATCLPPVGEWSFEEGSGLYAQDTSGNSNLGTLGVGSSAPIWNQGKIGKGLKFDGSNDYISMSQITLLDTWTLNFWVKANSFSSFNSFIGDLNSDSHWNRVGISSNNALSIRSRAMSSSTWSYSFNTNTWYYVSIVNNGAGSNNVTAYINGVSLGSVTNSGPGVGTWYTKIGWDGASSADYWNGSLDQVRIFNYARTPAQIAWDYNQGKPIAYWDFDECTGTTLHDRSGNNNNGTLTVGATGTQTTAGSCDTTNTASAWYNGRTGKYGPSLNFDGTDDYVSTSPISSLTTNFTVSAWVKWATGASGYDLIYQSGTATNYWNISINTVNKLSFTENGIANYESNGTIIQDSWNHIAVVKNGDSGTNITFYLNGQQVGTASVGTVTTPSGTAYIGTANGTSNFYSGQLDDVRIYNYALTVSQVKQLYNESSGIRFGP